MPSLLYYLPDCGCKERTDEWLGALLGRRDIGCAINVLVFLGAINEHFGKSLVPRLDPQVGTPFHTIIEAIQPTCAYPLREETYPITDVKSVTKILDEIEDGLKFGIASERERGKKCTDACTLVKLYRGTGGVGHTVIMSVEKGHMYTVDPQAETQDTIAMAGKGKIMRERGNDAKIFMAWNNTSFVAVSVIMAKVSKDSDTSEEMQIDSVSDTDDSPAHGIGPNQPSLGNIYRSTQPAIGDPTDLTERGRVYSIMAHGAVCYKPMPDDGQMPHDEAGASYDIECLTIPKNIVILTMTSVGEPLLKTDHRGVKHLRVGRGLPYHATMGMFRYERWGAKKGKSHFQFPNYSLTQEHDPGDRSAMGIYERQGPRRQDMRKVFDLEASGNNKQIFWYDFGTFAKPVNKIVTGTVQGEMSSLRDSIEIIKRDAGLSGRGKIYIFCTFCLGGMAPISFDKVRRCCDPSSIDAALPGKTIASKKKSRKSTRRKRKNTRKKPKKK